MRRFVIFLLVLACGIGAVAAAHVELTKQGDDVIITETVLQGDTAWAQGRTIHLTTLWNQHLCWDLDYTIGGDYAVDSYFEQEYERDVDHGLGVFSSYACVNFGASGTEMKLSGDRGYAPLFRSIAERTADGTEHTETIRLADYLKYYPLEVELYYHKDEYYYDNYEGTDLFDYINGDADAGKKTEIERFINENFAVPVGEDDTAEITVAKDNNGTIYQVGMNLINGNVTDLTGVITESGLYFWTESYNDDGCTVVGGCESLYGPGVYLIPWKVTGTSGTRTVVAPDVEKCRLVYPMDADTRLYITETAWDETQLRFVTWEDGWFRYTALDTKTAQVVAQIDLLEKAYGEDMWLSWAWSDEAVCTQIGDTLVLLWDQNGEVSYEFSVPAGENDNFLAEFKSEYDAITYDGEKLLMVIVSLWWHEAAEFTVCGYDREGLQLLAEYDSTLNEIEQWLGYNSFDTIKPVIE